MFHLIHYTSFRYQVCSVTVKVLKSGWSRSISQGPHYHDISIKHATAGQHQRTKYTELSEAVETYSRSTTKTGFWVSSMIVDSRSGLHTDIQFITVNTNTRKVLNIPDNSYPSSTRWMKQCGWHLAVDNETDKYRRTRWDTAYSMYKKV